jgi:HEAT repeat protein
VSRTGRKRGLWALPAAGLGLALAVLVVARLGRGPIPPVYDPAPGLRVSYEIEYTTSSEADFRFLFEDAQSAPDRQDPAPPLMAQSTGTFLQGGLVATVVRAGPDRLLWAYRLERPSIRLEVNGREEPAQAAAIAASLDRDWFVRADARGRVSGVLMAPDAGRQAERFVQALIAQIQVVLPGSSRFGVRDWKAEEDGPNGTFLAGYAKTDSFDGRKLSDLPKGLRAFRKTKIRYSPEGADARSLLLRLPTTVAPEGSWDILFDVRGGCVEAMSGSETERVSVAGREVARVESALSLQRTGSETVAAPDLDAMRRSFEDLASVAGLVPLAVVVPEEESELAVQRSALGGGTLESLVGELERAEAEGQTRDTALYLKFKALVYLHPGTSAALTERLSSAPPGALAWDVVAGALGAVGHPEAQAALAGLLRARGEEPEIVMALVQTLAMVRFPTEEAERALRELAEDPAAEPFHPAALFGLGSMAYRLRDVEPARAGRIVEDLLSRIRDSLPERDVEVILKSLGNSGSGQALPAFRKYARHRESSLRAAAAAGLRFVKAAGAERLLIKMLRSDPDASVRAAAALAFSFRAPTRAAMRAHGKTVAKDASESVRIAALRNLGAMSREFPEALDAVRRAAGKDPSENVRKAALALLPADRDP